MELSKEKVLDLARKIYMDMSDEEAEKLMLDVGKEIADAKLINITDTKDVKADISVLNRNNSLRKDEVAQYENLKGLLSNAKEVEDSMFVLPKIVQN